MCGGLHFCVGMASLHKFQFTSDASASARLSGRMRDSNRKAHSEEFFNFPFFALSAFLHLFVDSRHPLKFCILATRDS